MKTLTLILAFIVFSSMGTKEENPIVGKETLIDMIERAEYIPVYFVTKEVLYSHKVSSYSTCNKMTEVLPLPATFEPAYDKLVAELNRVFKTNKFVAKPASDIPLLETNGKKSNGKFSSWAPKKISPSLKKYNFSEVTAPFFVFCSIGAIYKNNSLLLTGDLGKMQLKQLESEGKTLVEKTDVILQGFVNVRLLNYDSKKGKVNYANLEVLNVFTSVDDEVFESTECISSIKDCTSQIDPSMVAEDLISEIDGMFDRLAASELGIQIEVRPADPVILEVAPYQPVTKEPIEDKFSRINDSGNYIGVRLYIQDLNDQSKRSLVEHGYDESLEQYSGLSSEVANVLKEILATENVEVIDTAKLPLLRNPNDPNAIDYYDYWSTKYKVIFKIDLKIRIGDVQDMNGNWTCSYGVFSEISAIEYFKDPIKGKLKSKWVASIPSSGYSSLPVKAPYGECDYSKLEIVSRSEEVEINTKYMLESIRVWAAEKLN